MTTSSARSGTPPARNLDRGPSYVAPTGLRLVGSPLLYTFRSYGARPFAIKTPVTVLREAALSASTVPPLSCSSCSSCQTLFSRAQLTKPLESHPINSNPLHSHFPISITHRMSAGTPPSKRPWTLRAALGLALLAAVVWFARHHSAHRTWNEIVAVHAARGEFLDRSIAPKPSIPENQDFAATPLLKPLLDFDPGSNADRTSLAVWRATQAIRRLESIRLPPLNPANHEISDGRLDLKSWQAAFHAEPGFHIVDAPNEPAREILSALRRWDTELSELEAASHRADCSLAYDA